MTNYKKEVINDMLSGLLVAATFATMMPVEAMAQLTTTVSSAGTNVLQPAMTGLSYISYGIGAVMVVAGIAHTKKHADAPSNNPLTPALGKLFAGGAFLAAPTIIGALAATGTSLNSGTATVKTLQAF